MPAKKTLAQRLLKLAEDELIKTVQKRLKEKAKPKEPERFKDNNIF